MVLINNELNSTKRYTKTKQAGTHRYIAVNAFCIFKKSLNSAPTSSIRTTHLKSLNRKKDQDIIHFSDVTLFLWCHTINTFLWRHTINTFPLSSILFTCTLPACYLDANVAFPHATFNWHVLTSGTCLLIPCAFRKFHLLDNKFHA